MIARKSILILIGLSMIAAMAACGGSSTSMSDPPITVKLSAVPASLQVSATQSVTATTNDTAGVAWRCTPGNSAATCGSFSSSTSASGTAVTYTAPATVPASAVVITAISMTNTAISSSTPAITIDATTPPPSITVTLSTVPTSLNVNDTISVTATVANDSANGGVTWSCAPAGSCGSLSSSTSASGVAVTYTAPATVPASTVVITATSVTNTAMSSSTPAITINAAVTPPPSITVTLSATPASLYVNDTTLVTATVANDLANGGVTWSCAPVGSCGTFSSPSSASGVPVTYTAPATVPASAVVITASSVSNTAISSSSPSITIKATVISVALTTAPPSLLFEGGNATLAATVSGDPAGRGVNWSCTPASSCGSFNPTGTASAASTVYTAGSTAGAVVITATSVSDNAQSAGANVTITRGLATGTYVFSLTGTSTDGYLPYSVAGAFTVVSGVISGGEQDFVHYFVNANDQINPTGSSISLTADGNLQITLVTCNGSNCNSTDTNIGVNGDGIEILDGSMLPLSTNGRTFIIEFDGSATSSGELGMQDRAAASITPSLGYVFGVNGLDSNGIPLSMGGIINVDNLSSTGSISGTGSIFDANDGESGTTFQAETFGTGSVAITPTNNSFGRVLFKLHATDNIDFPEIVLAGYIVDSNRIRLVETFDPYAGSLAGTAFSQGTNTGQFTSASIAGSSYVVGLSGYDPNGVLQVAGLIAFGATSVNGFVDFNDLVLVEPASPDPVSAPAYTVDSTGRVTITGLADTTDVADFNLQLYLDGNGHALAITMDSSDVIGGGGSAQSGGGSFAFSGAYGVNVTGWDPNYDGEFDAIGPVVATGSSGTIAGTVDLNWLFSAGPTYSGAPASGTFTSNANGIFTGTVTGVDVTNCPAFTPTGPGCTPDVFNYYLIDATGDNIAIETDTNQLTLGLFAQQ
jgi:hypothetical protein